MKNIVNIINFVRGVEPRPGRNIDLKKPVIKQIEIMKENGLRGTFLLQYDALTNPEFLSIMETCRDFCEIGIWLEVVQPQVEAAGGIWQGRYSWDWHNDVGFLIGYEPEFRKKLIDVAMSKFKEIFGYYPKSVGSWHIDAVSLKYLHEKYKIVSSCNCREQVGTDGYTMQGGYYNQAYYPSVNNMFCPAGSKETQINVPVFRMLGSSPITAYDYQAVNYTSNEYTPTMETIGYGRDKSWCEWFFRETMQGYGLTFQYAQIGQENSFGWDNMGAGIEIQFPMVKALAEEGKLEVLTLEETGKWFSSRFDTTPASSFSAFSLNNGEDYKGVWYSSRFYRAGFLWNDGIVRLRDLYMFDDRYKEHYLEKRCDSHACEFRNLPIMDGAIYSSPEIVAGIYLTQGNEPVRFDDFEYLEKGSEVIITLKKGTAKTTLTFSEKEIDISSDIPSLELNGMFDTDRFYGNPDSADSTFANHNNSKTNITYVSEVKTEGNKTLLTFDGFTYAFTAEKGKLTGFLHIMSDTGEIKLNFKNE